MKAKTTTKKSPANIGRRKCFVCHSIITYESQMKQPKKKKMACNSDAEPLYTERLGKIRQKQVQNVTN